jgi:hypothetical protein
MTFEPARVDRPVDDFAAAAERFVQSPNRLFDRG